MYRQYLVLIAITAPALTLIAGLIARLPGFFSRDEDDIQRLPHGERAAIRAALPTSPEAPDFALPSDEPDGEIGYDR